MAGLATIRDYFRDAAGAGINAAAYTIKRLVDDVTIASGSTASDTDPSVALAGMLDEDETTLGGYPGPLKYTATDPTSGAVRIHTSKSVGLVGSWRSIDIPRVWRALGTGVQPGINNELAVTTNGTNMDIAIATGACVVAIGEYALFYSYPSAQTLTAGASDPTNPRIDTVVLRFYPPGVEQEGRVILALLAGTPAASPSPPALTQSVSTYWEYPLADVRVNATVTSLATDKVTDRRTYSLLYPGTIAAGDVFYVDANAKLARLAKGTSGQFLQIGATIPTWADAYSVGGTDVAVADGGTGASTASAARTNLAAAPLAATYIVQTADAELSAEQALSALATGIVKNTTGTGVLSIATAGTDYYAPGSTDVAVADGGTGSSTAAGARTNLGLVIGTDVQAADADLTALAGLAATAGMLSRTGAGAFAARTLTGTTDHINVTNGTGASANPTFDLAAAHLGDYLVVDVSQDNTDYTNTSTVNYADAVSTTITLPAGTWTLYAIGGGTFDHSTTMTTHCLLRLDGTDGGFNSIGSLGSGSAKSTITSAAVKTGVTSGAKTCSVRFKSGSAGTITADSSWIAIMAIRTA